MFKKFSGSGTGPGKFFMGVLFLVKEWDPEFQTSVSWLEQDLCSIHTGVMRYGGDVTVVCFSGGVSTPTSSSGPPAKQPRVDSPSLSSANNTTM